MTYPIVLGHLAAHRLDLETFAAAADLHPDMVRRWAALGLIELVPDPRGEPSFPLGELAAVARLRRLRTRLGLNHAALGVVVDLLDRIAELETTLARSPRRPGG